MRYEDHPVFDRPDNENATIWRYIDFTRLVSLLDSRCLFFARSDHLDDPFEGSVSRATVTALATALAEWPPEVLAQFQAQIEGWRRHTYVNCWSLSDYESAALWSLYVPPSGGVALRSTFRRLVDAILPSPEDGADPPHDRTVYVGRVRYADYDKAVIPPGNTLWPFVYKRRSFDFEQELRACVQRFPLTQNADGTSGGIDLTLDSPRGHEIAVDLDVLIEAIHVSPTAPTWFSSLVESVCGKYALDKPVIASALADRPIY